MQAIRPLIFTASILFLAHIFSGCAVTRKSTTDRTAVGQALMSFSAEDSICAIDLKRVEGMNLYIDSSELISKDKEVITSMIRQHLLEEGAHIVAEEDAEARVFVRADFSAIDDSETFIGIPAVPVPIPGVGTLSTPELALFKLVTQLGRNKPVYYSIYNQDGSLAFAAEPDPGQRYYKRWTILIFIGFRTTNLPKPF